METPPEQCEGSTRRRCRPLVGTQHHSINLMRSRDAMRMTVSACGAIPNTTTPSTAGEKRIEWLANQVSSSQFNRPFGRTPPFCWRHDDEVEFGWQPPCRFGSRLCRMPNGGTPLFLCNGRCYIPFANTTAIDCQTPWCHRPWIVSPARTRDKRCC
jgi:hypothetical protein